MRLYIKIYGQLIHGFNIISDSATKSFISFNVETFNIRFTDLPCFVVDKKLADQLLKYIDNDSYIVITGSLYTYNVIHDNGKMKLSTLFTVHKVYVPKLNRTFVDHNWGHHYE